MKILLTGATGYIGKRLLPVLTEDDHQVVCLVRNRNRLVIPDALKSRTEVVEGDLLSPATLGEIPADIDTAIYLVHSMSHQARDFGTAEQQCAANFVHQLKQTAVQQIIYLSGIVNDANLSHHLRSRMAVETILRESGIPTTVLRAGIIIGSGSASFEIIRDLVEKLPVMLAPKWLNNRIQPIAIHDVLHYLRHTIGNPKCAQRIFDIGGPDILTYREMLLRFSKVRGFKRFIFTVPVLTPRLSSYWLYFVTSTSFSLSRSLVDSLKNEVICQNSNINEIIPHTCLSYERSVEKAFSRIAENAVVSSWKDAWVSGTLEGNYSDFVEVPTHGCLMDKKSLAFTRNPEEILNNLWSIGGERGWYGLDWLWKLRGYLDRLAGGVGLRRGRTDQHHLKPGDALDFWRVLLADRQKMRLLLYAEMKLPGEAWLEFRITPAPNGGILYLNATFRPYGLSGRLYWYSVLPFHYFVFRKLIEKIISYEGPAL